MSSDGLRFDDFDLDLQTDGSSNTVDAAVATALECLASNGTYFNSSTSVCCATATNVTETCSWCNYCQP